MDAPIVEVEILNPYNEKEFLDDKLSVVDVKARDDRKRLIQVEVQIQAYRHLPQRIAYTWCDLYVSQLEAGQDYKRLRPTYSIWLLADSLITNDPEYAHDYQLRDRQGRRLWESGGIRLLELAKFQAQRIDTPEQHWLKFFKDGGTLDDQALPDWMQTPEMRQAMNMMKRFSEKTEDYYRYQARQNYLREQSTIRGEYEEDLEHERAEKEKALAEIERLEEESLAQVERLKEESLRERAADRAEIERLKEVSLREKEADLAEIERLKAMLAKKDG